MKDKFSDEILEYVLDALPASSALDSDDVVRLFNKNGDRIFPRPVSVIGHKVRDCHSEKSLHKVVE